MSWSPEWEEFERFQDELEAYDRRLDQFWRFDGDARPTYRAEEESTDLEEAA